MAEFIVLFVISALVIMSIIIMVATRYKKCPSDHIMVVFGKVGKQRSAKCIHGGAQFVVPFFQDFRFLSLRPMQIDINLRGALSRQNIRINTPSTYTIGISTEPDIMQNAAERLLSMTPKDIEVTAREIIFGQQRLVIASMDIEEINSNRDAFLQNIRANVETELNKIGLRLINVNITDITDEEDYLTALGKRAASEVTNRAKIEVAQQEKIGETGKANEDKERRVAVAQAEAKAAQGEAEASKEKRIAISRADSEAVTGEANADKNKRIKVKEADALAVAGENESAMSIAQSNANRREVEEESRRRAESAAKQADAKILSAAYEAEKLMQIKRAEMINEQETAEKVVPAKVEKTRKEIEAEAQAEISRRTAKGEADALFATMDAQARGQFEILQAKANGFREIISACGGNPNAAATMLMIEKLETLIQAQVEAIKNIKIDKVVVWDNQGQGQNKSSTANFISGLAGSLPPLHDIARSAGIDLPEFLGHMREQDEDAKAGAKTDTSVQPAVRRPASKTPQTRPSTPGSAPSKPGVSAPKPKPTQS